MTDILKVNPQEYGIEEQTAENLTEGLKPVLDERKLLIQRFGEVKDLPMTEENVSVFKELRLRFRDNRTKGINKWHEKTKQVPLRMGQLIDAIKRSENSVNETHEEILERGEKHFENLEKERLIKLRSDRWKLLSAFMEDEPHGLGQMSDDVFKHLLDGAKASHEAKLEAERKAEEDRLEQERKAELLRVREKAIAPVYSFFEVPAIQVLGELTEKEFDQKLEEAKEAKADHEAEQQKQRKENERLKAEAEKRENEIEAERKKQAEKEAAERKERVRIQAEAEAKLKAERQAREKAEAEIKARQDAEEKARKKAESEAKKAAKAPEQERLKRWVASICAENPIHVDGLSDEGKAIVKKIDEKTEALKQWAYSLIEKQ